MDRSVASASTFPEIRFVREIRLFKIVCYANTSLSASVTYCNRGGKVGGRSGIGTIKRRAENESEFRTSANRFNIVDPDDRRSYWSYIYIHASVRTEGTCTIDVHGARGPRLRFVKPVTWIDNAPTYVRTWCIRARASTAFILIPPRARNTPECNALEYNRGNAHV